MRLLPLVAEEPSFALKGGTAINLFVRNLPRLSVDIDLVYLPVNGRSEALADIDTAMKRIEARIMAALPAAIIGQTVREGAVLRLAVRTERTQVKIEVSPVLRGVVQEPALRSVSPAVEEHYGFAEIRLVSFADLYAGKLVAALDRQHPRDLFDVRDLLANEGLTPALREAFLVYLISHDRPMAEVLSCRFKDIRATFTDNFDGMTETPVTLAELESTREELVRSLVRDMPQEHKDFLLGFEAGSPDWSLLSAPHAAELPAVRWRQINLDKLDAAARDRLVVSLREAMSG
ncbi:nucleotidyl transferase AbiEii/AbiGii toxin family protein [Roseicyclus mahoneyensis]|uniref:Nucleotidyltransferase AbiEii toxin of type IV toxin-antitoxin system n=1 Tax=Roseicyclus mahoneyensis TaxID=164332 RepID=A0A316GPP8_9RHOB|nr:nucleotidyl transferase AbiEii/AbiGii toxin family protein [Roseicyclus mahoneyensis]PWK62022.1 nucleotidyltransferase AbiEii toxin of type IV toxin-antitoxin system [Roseicyclus mahoneyensis]